MSFMCSSFSTAFLSASSFSWTACLTCVLASWASHCRCSPDKTEEMTL
eukprot:CAMPEP_0202408542 /NCGR_PEP_ID=MMETSP1128-20130828/15007_1 /ASSEMBLY_ACC=CAM_ASM_000463 /TAXON_ID=3047 /ORGANISM="Dunaliella tertiolecta, Strain CCMP1320" /LENGTH=47 /DNA_ID= /DNA_START= /DNA_END= /DNA_ORIENTATION=